MNNEEKKVKYALTHCNIIDGTKNAELQQDMTILVNGEKIEEIRSADKPVADEYKQIDLSGKYVLPGLINLHVHLFGTGKPSKVLGAGGLQKLVIKFASTGAGKKVLRGIIAGNLSNALNAGITTVRSVGDFF